MKSIVSLYDDLLFKQSTEERLAVLVQYFQKTEKSEAAIVLKILAGNRPKRVIALQELITLACNELAMPSWLFDDCVQAIGDKSEVLALIWQGQSIDNAKSLVQFSEELEALHKAHISEVKSYILASWNESDTRTRYILNKFYIGTFSFNIELQIVIQALAIAFGIDSRIIAYHLELPYFFKHPDFYDRLRNPIPEYALPYEFCTAKPYIIQHPLSKFRIEPKWDGLRCQLIRREGQTYLWYKGNKLITHKVPELDYLHTLPPSVSFVIDGILVIYKDNHVGPSSHIHKRLKLKKVTMEQVEQSPLQFIILDILHYNGIDIRSLQLQERVIYIPQVAEIYPEFFIENDVLSCTDQQSLAQEKSKLCYAQYEGLFIRSLFHPYAAGNEEWYKITAEPLLAHVVLLYAERGNGHQAHRYTQFNVGAYYQGELVPLSRMMSTLEDEELEVISQWIKSNTIERFGPVRSVNAALVMQMQYLGVYPSHKHKSGVMIKQPIITKVCWDLTLEDVISVEQILEQIS